MSSTALKPVVTRETAVRLAIEQQHKEKWMQSVPAEYRDMWATCIGEDMITQNDELREMSRTVSKRMSAAAGIQLEMNVTSTNVTGIPPAQPLSRAYRSGNISTKSENNVERVQYLLSQLESQSDDVVANRTKETISNMTKVQMSNTLANTLKAAIEKTEKQQKRTKTSPPQVEVQDVITQLEKTKLAALYSQQVQKDLTSLQNVSWQ